jgi:hypothetical protein
MLRIRNLLFLTLLLCGLTACPVHLAPTPILIGPLIKANDEVKQLYLDCSTGANYTPKKEGCNPQLLEEKIVSTLGQAKNFISADIQQPQGYDIYLSVTMIYFRIGQRNGLEYTEAERIARQFFEVQKASSGRALNDARFYWAAVLSGHAAWQWFNDRLALDADRKVDLLLCYAQGSIALQSMSPSPRKIRLAQYLDVIKEITSRLE